MEKATSKFPQVNSKIVFQVIGFHSQNWPQKHLGAIFAHYWLNGKVKRTFCPQEFSKTIRKSFVFFLPNPN